MTFKTTKHSAIDRQERIIEIATKIGDFGEIIATKQDDEKQVFENLTTQGIIIITAYSDPKRVVTMFIASFNQAKNFFKDKKLPRMVELNIQRNYKIGLKTWTDDKKKKKKK